MERYSPRGLGNPNLVMCKDNTGRWVKYSEYQELQAQVDAVKKVELKLRLSDMENYHRGVRREIAADLREALEQKP